MIIEKNCLYLHLRSYDINAFSCRKDTKFIQFVAK
jgi:hypothetical protein